MGVKLTFYNHGRLTGGTALSRLQQLSQNRQRWDIRFTLKAKPIIPGMVSVDMHRQTCIYTFWHT